MTQSRPRPVIITHANAVDTKKTPRDPAVATRARFRHAEHDLRLRPNGVAQSTAYGENENGGSTWMLPPNQNFRSSGSRSPVILES